MKTGTHSPQNTDIVQVHVNILVVTHTQTFVIVLTRTAEKHSRRFVLSLHKSSNGSRSSTLVSLSANLGTLVEAVCE